MIPIINCAQGRLRFIILVPLPILWSLLYQIPTILHVPGGAKFRLAPPIHNLPAEDPRQIPPCTILKK